MISRLPMQVRDGDDVDAIGLYRIQKLVGETAQHNVTDVAAFDWRRQGRVTQARQRLPDFRAKTPPSPACCRS